MNLLELYAGSGTVSKEFAARGHNTFKVDIRSRKGVCEPDLRINIMELETSQIPFRPDVIWCSFPCQVFSYAAGDFHFKYGDPVSAQAHHMLKLLIRTLDLIRELGPAFYFIENPRGQLRYIKTLLDWLVKNNGMTKELTYSSYGFPTTKPTNLFTNALLYQPRTLAPYGRGHKNPLDVFDKMTVCQKQKIPQALAHEIALWCEANIPALPESAPIFA